MLQTQGCSEAANPTQHTTPIYLYGPGNSYAIWRGFPLILAAILFLPPLTELKTFPFDALLGSLLKLSLTLWVPVDFRVELRSEHLLGFTREQNWGATGYLLSPSCCSGHP